MFTMLETYDVQETRRVAKAEGRDDERLAIARRLLKRQIPADEIADITGLSKQEVEELSKPKI